MEQDMEQEQARVGRGCGVPTCGCSFYLPSRHDRDPARILYVILFDAECYKEVTMMMREERRRGERKIKMRGREREEEER